MSILIQKINSNTSFVYRVLHQLWSDSSRHLLSNYFQGLHSLHQHDRDAILGNDGMTNSIYLSPSNSFICTCKLLQVFIVLLPMIKILLVEYSSNYQWLMINGIFILHITLHQLIALSVMAVGFAFATFGPESLSEVGFIETTISTVFAHLPETSQLRIKPIIRILFDN